MQCDKKTCSSFGMFSICSHCIAATEHQRGLASYLTAFNKVHRTKNLSKVVSLVSHLVLEPKVARESLGKKKMPPEVSQYIST